MRKTVTPPPCSPTGSLAPYRPTHPVATGCPHCGHRYTCLICEVPLLMLPISTGTEWGYYGPDGNMTGRIPFPPMHPATAETFRDQARRTKGGPAKREQAIADMEVWLSWRTGANVMIDCKFHTHHPESHVCPGVEPYPGPTCCDQPMWAAPRGWVCRVSKTVFGTTSGPLAGNDRRHRMFTLTGLMNGTGEPYDLTVGGDEHEPTWGIAYGTPNILTLLAGLEGALVLASPTGPALVLDPDDETAIYAAAGQHTRILSTTGDVPVVDGMDIPDGAVA